ncbi:MAG TPA: acyl-CoA synthetase [Acidimicrobiales bacterium]|nr:acyl-CoA synthetase [Acidimicrobiales bacterium]
MDFNLADVFEAVADAIPDQDAIVWGDRRWSYRELDERANQLANVLHDAGLGAKRGRQGLGGHETHQDHLAVYLYNGNEYLEAMLGAFKARLAPFNVNYRYVEEELLYLLDSCEASAIVFDSRFADTLAAVLPELPRLQTLIQVGDGPLLEGAIAYEDALAAVSRTAPPVDRSPDDLYILCTGGTTGMPKGVLWRQADIFMGSMGGRDLTTGVEKGSLEEIVDAAKNSGGAKVLPAPPFMHGAAQWVAFSGFNGGSTIVIQDDVVRLEPDDIWRTVDREGVNILLIVGDAFGRPLVEELETGQHDGTSLLAIISGGAPLNSTLKDRFLAALPSVMILDAVGASETGSQMSHVSAAGAKSSTGRFTPGPSAAVVSADLTQVLEPGHDGDGWLAQRGRVPLGYLGDAEKTARTFPVIEGTRFAVPGDRARLTAEGEIELFGRDSVTINSGGEKIFAEEVEQALAHHPAVFDVVVAGRPSDKWGNEVVAIVQLRDGAEPDEQALRDEAAKHVARYKLPKAFVFVDSVVRSPAGKADYRWAKEQALTA